MVNSFTVAICVLAVPKLKFFQHITIMFQNKKTLFFLFILVMGITVLMLIQSKLIKEIQAEIFVFVVPLLAIIYKIIQQWICYQKETSELEEEVAAQRSAQDSYDELLEHIRIRQHDFNNQITGIIGTHYSYNTYEDIVKAQQKYCLELMNNNRYNQLLLIGNKVVAGFLYRKFLEMEKAGIHIDYKISACKLKTDILDYQLIEVLGILLDNAMEAVGISEFEKIVKYEMKDVGNEYLFKVSNISNYFPYSQIEEWFCLGTSTKGKERGIGLYRIKQWCEERNSEIFCSNVEEKGKNWIQFVLRIEKGEFT